MAGWVVGIRFLPGTQQEGAGEAEGASPTLTSWDTPVH